MELEGPKKPFMFHVASSREGFKNRDTTDIEFVRSHKNPADGPTYSLRLLSLVALRNLDYAIKNA